MSETMVPLVLNRITLVGQEFIIQKQGKTNLSHDGLNPSHVPFWVVNNHTLSKFCFRRLKRDDIEGSKSSVDLDSWLPQASYPYGNFSDTSNFS